MRGVLLILVLLAVPGCRASYAVNVGLPVEPATGVQVAGTWRSDWTVDRRQLVAVLMLEQTGAEVRGTYVTTGFPGGRLEGTLTGNELTGRWMEDGGQEGRFRFVFHADGRRFEGTWGVAHEDDGGIWHGER